ncbi:MAG TPA: hypothetical protein VGC88_00755, partial [Terriglobales bacterium]
LLNSGASEFFTAKCDVWSTQELDEEEQIFAADWKRSSYIDVVLRDPTERTNFAACEQRMREWVRSLRTGDVEGSVSVVLRECVVNHAAGFYWTIYVSGYGDTEAHATQAWEGALTETTAVLRGDAL